MQDNQQEAVSCVDRCREMLLRLPKEAKVLRLLARVYLELDCQTYQDKALVAVCLANKEYLEPAGIYLKIRILLKTGTVDELVKSELKELLDSEVELDVCLTTVKLLIAEDRETLAFNYLNMVCKHFESSPEVGSALVLHIELLLMKGKDLLAKMKIEDAISGHFTGRQLSPNNLTSLHLLLWDKAARRIEDRNYYEALQWYNYSLSFHKAGELDQNLAKLQRNRASCFLYLQQIDKAKEAISEALKCDPNSVFTHFSVYKIAILENNIEKAVEAIGDIDVLSQKRASNEDELLVTENAATNLLILAAQIALDVTWNTALQCENNSVRMKEFFLLCYQTEILTQALECIQICWEIWRTLKTSGTYTRDQTDTLLLLYEFEARAKLNDPKLGSVLESILELENIDAKILETVASLAMRPPAHFPVVCKKALTIALSLHKQGPQADPTRCCYCLHTLIQLSLPSGVCEVDPRILEEVWGYYEEALAIISAASEDFPELEILWLLTRAWNTGILLYSLSQYTEAEKWCGLGISFLQHLGSMQDSYQTQMSGLYSEVLDKLDKAKKNQVME
ncbi:Testis-expressed protein 11 [Bagarius yarrelli]|uniref:Protein ZIP4 homolog n=1 Tax=Bagarius yarrelli TaxID=175774 RepID=A0A556V0E8_BAGYA|nr:Testis-expressed protein 11 [Bagarius yarrelli]